MIAIYDEKEDLNPKDGMSNIVKYIDVLSFSQWSRLLNDYIL